MPPGGAKLRYHLCMTCGAIARVSVRSNFPITRHLEPDVPNTHYKGLLPLRCDKCTSGSSVDINILYNTLPADLSYCVYLSCQAKRWITVDCEQLLRSFADKDFYALAASIRQCYKPNTIINATHMRYLLQLCPFSTLTSAIVSDAEED